ncbi:MAG: tRNA (cytidine(34)-2'-O)-methyltransferase [Proteobacteria bacterium]|nr:tRNA (cytidine(34)-2'-O)-methyltransferase [Burkholderiales bacterium]
MFQIVLVHPEIAPNTGNVIRLAANTGCRLHLVEPMGFVMTDKGLKRAGLDYHEYVRIVRHPGWADCAAALGSARRFAITTRGERRYSDIAFGPDDAFVFGAETRGLPAEVLAAFEPSHRLRLPMRPESRSLNLGNAVAAVVFEAWRQCGFTDGV